MLLFISMSTTFFSVKLNSWIRSAQIVYISLNMAETQINCIENRNIDESFSRLNVFFSSLFLVSHFKLLSSLSIEL